MLNIHTQKTNHLCQVGLCTHVQAVQSVLQNCTQECTDVGKSLSCAWAGNQTIPLCLGGWVGYALETTQSIKGSLLELDIFFSLDDFNIKNLGLMLCAKYVAG